MGVLTGCIPRTEVLTGELDDAIFAADFGDVIDGKAPDVYKDAATFFRNTHPAQQLCRLVQAVFRRLADSSEGGAAVRLSTGFGGGKTHTLIALWHLAKNVGNPGLGTELLPAAGRPKAITTIAVDASKAGVPVFAVHDDVHVRSLWGEIFYQLGGTAALRALGPADDPESSPSETQIEAALPSGPLLFLLDELVVYMARLSERGQGNLLGFLGSLTAVVTRRPQTVLIVTDPADQRVYAKQAARIGDSLADAAIRLDDVLGRKFSDFDPIGNEAARVIVRRLFDRVDLAEAQRVSSVYYELYKRVAADLPGALPTQAATMEYARRVVDSYPFHPRLLDTAQDRLGALADFQKSRGVLRLFARILRDVWERREDVEIISAGEIDWASPRIRADLLQRLNRDGFRGAADADVGRHAGELDGSDANPGSPRGVHRRVASALLLESIPLQPSSGLDGAEATLAVLRPDEAGDEPGAALDRLAGVCWHIYPLAGGRGFQFRYEENVLKQIEERKVRFLEEAKDLVRAEAQQFFNGPQLKLCAWPSSAQQVAPVAELQLALCDSEDLARRVCAYEDESDPNAPMPRGFRNAVLAVAPSPSAYSLAIERAQRVLAAEEIKKDYEKDPAQKLAFDQLAQKVLPDLRKQVRVQTYRAFDRLVLGSGTAYRIEDPLQVDDDELLKGPRGQTIILKFLEDKQLIYASDDAVDVDLFLTKILPGATPVAGRSDVYTAKAIHERFLAAPDLRLISGPNVVRKTLLNALADGRIVIQRSNGDAFDARGCVCGPSGARRRGTGSLLGLNPDDATLVARADSAAAADWLREDAIEAPSVDGGTGGSTGADFGPPPPSDRVTVKVREELADYATNRPLVELKLIARQPSLAGQLASLAQPLGADSLTLDLAVSGTARDGGQIRFSVAGVRPGLAIRPLQMAQTIFNSLSDGASYEAMLTLHFAAEGRTGMQEQLTKLGEDAPDGVLIEAEFGATKPAAVAS